MTEEEKAERVRDVIKMCQDDATVIFKKMISKTVTDDRAMDGLHAYLYGFLSPLMASMYGSGKSEADQGVRMIISEMMDFLKDKYEKEPPSIDDDEDDGPEIVSKLRH